MESGISAALARHTEYGSSRIMSEPSGFVERARSLFLGEYFDGHGSIHAHPVEHLDESAKVESPMAWQAPPLRRVFHVPTDLDCVGIVELNHEESVCGD